MPLTDEQLKAVSDTSIARTKEALEIFLARDPIEFEEVEIRMLAWAGYTTPDSLTSAREASLEKLGLRPGPMDAILAKQNPKASAAAATVAGAGVAAAGVAGAGVPGGVQLEQLITALKDAVVSGIEPLAASLHQLVLQSKASISVAISSINSIQCQEALQRFGLGVIRVQPPDCFPQPSPDQLQQFADMPSMVREQAEDHPQSISAFTAHMAQIFVKLGLDLEVFDVHGVKWLEARRDGSTVSMSQAALLTQKVHIKLGKTDYLVVQKGFSSSLPHSTGKKGKPLSAAQLQGMLQRTVALIETKTTNKLTNERAKSLAQGGAEFIAVNACNSGEFNGAFSGKWRIPVIVTDGKDHSVWHEVESKAHLIQVAADQGDAGPLKMCYFLQQLLQESLNNLPSASLAGGPSAGLGSGPGGPSSGAGSGAGPSSGSGPGGPSSGTSTRLPLAGKRKTRSQSKSTSIPSMSADSSDAAVCDLIEQLDQDVWFAQAFAAVFKAVEEATGTPLHANLAAIDIRKSRWFQHAD